MCVNDVELENVERDHALVEALRHHFRLDLGLIVTLRARERTGNCRELVVMAPTENYPDIIDSFASFSATTPAFRRRWCAIETWLTDARLTDRPSVDGPLTCDKFAAKVKLEVSRLDTRN